LAYALAPNTSLNLRGAGQYAFNPLTPDMGFTLGSNTGLRGLPGQTISGDSGYLGTAEIVWTVWRRATTAIQLVPFIGYGGINTNRYTIKRGPLVFNNGIGAGGVMARFLSGPNWQLEVGWVQQIDAHDQLDNAIWGSDYLIGRGLYTNLKYRF
jgi:hemolysin activation/secretion protein